MMILFLLLKILINKEEKGFTLLELMVVMLIVTVLSVITLPMTISAVGKAKETEAKQSLSAIGQGQQAYFFEHGTFSTALNDLDIGVSGKYYSFEEPLLINSTVVKQGAIGINARQANTREYQLGIYYDSNSFSLVLCQGLTENDTVEAPNRSNGSCIEGTKID